MGIVKHVELSLDTQVFSSPWGVPVVVVGHCQAGRPDGVPCP